MPDAVHHLLETRTVDTGGDEKTTIVSKDCCEVCWVAIGIEAPGTQGQVKIFDGFDTEGTLKCQLEADYEMGRNFIPPFRCNQGLTVYNDTNIGCWTIGYVTITKFYCPDEK